MSGKIAVTSTDGGSTISFGSSDGVRVGGNVSVNNAGYGADRVNLFGTFSGNIDLQFGNGDLSINAIRNYIGGYYSSSVQSGVSTHFFGETQVLGPGFITSRGGDTDLKMLWTEFRLGVFVTNGLGRDTYQITSVIAPQLDIANGNGGSALLLTTSMPDSRHTSTKSIRL